MKHFCLLVFLPVVVLFSSCKEAPPAAVDVPAAKAEELPQPLEEDDKNVSKSRRVLIANFREEGGSTLVLVTDFEGQALATVTMRRGEVEEEWSKELTMDQFEKFYNALESSESLRKLKVSEESEVVDAEKNQIVTTMNREQGTGAMYVAPVEDLSPALQTWFADLRKLTQK